MELEAFILERVRDYDTMSRRERAELGRDLRRHGLSYGEIMEILPVKKSTLATWCCEIELTEDQIAAIRERRTPMPGRDLQGLPYTTQRPRQREIELIRGQAKLEALHLVREPLWIAGVAMYWGEGTKTSRDLSMANSDPAVLRLFRDWALRYLPPDRGWRARLNIHVDNDEPTARRWWADQLALSVDDFTKTFVKPDGTGHRKNDLPHGVCTLRKRRSTDAYHTTIAWIEFLRELHPGKLVPGR